MRGISAWAFTGPLAVLASTIPRSSDASSDDAASIQGKTFRLGQMENAVYQGLDAPAEMLKAYAKYGDGLSSGLSEAIKNNPDMRSKYNAFIPNGDGLKGTVINFPPPFFDIQYVVPVQIGTPPQETYVNLDTGSADFWTFSTDTYQPQVKLQTLYNPQNSSTSKHLRGEAWNVLYGDGAGASGIVYLDRVQLGETFFDQQAVQAAVQVSRALTNDPFSSGILGLGMSSGNTVRPTKQKTYIDNIKNDLALPLFTANLQKGQPGNYNFGYLNQSEYKGEIGYAPVERGAAYWKISFPGYQVGMGGEFEATPWTGIVDTGTSLLLLPKVMVENYYAQVPGSYYDRYFGMMVFPCTAKLPDFIFYVEDYIGIVPGHYINYGKASRGLDCYGGIQSSETVPFAVIGAILIKSQFVVFDAGNMQVGFAAKQTVPPEY